MHIDVDPVAVTAGALAKISPALLSTGLGLMAANSVKDDLLGKRYRVFEMADPPLDPRDGADAGPPRKIFAIGGPPLKSFLDADIDRNMRGLGSRSGFKGRISRNRRPVTALRPVRKVTFASRGKRYLRNAASRPRRRRSLVGVYRRPGYWVPRTSLLTYRRFQRYAFR